jgi:predicted secreted protein
LAAVLDHAHEARQVCAFGGVGNFRNRGDILVEQHKPDEQQIICGGRTAA